MKIYCPNCDVPMNEVVTKSHYDVPVYLDQCPKCGGIWFDKSELYYVKHGESEKIELDEDKLVNSKLIKDPPLYCPNDKSELIIFKDLNFPKELLVEKCGNCHGFWFNRGEFQQYQDYREERKNRPKDPKFEEAIQSFLDAESSKDGWNTVGKVAEFLSSPVYGSRNPMVYSTAYNAMSLYGVVLGVLFSMFLKRK